MPIHSRRRRPFIALLMLSACALCFVAPEHALRSQDSTNSRNLEAEARRRSAAFAWRQGLDAGWLRTFYATGNSTNNRRSMAEFLASEEAQPYARWLIVQRLAGFAMEDGDYSRAAQIWRENRGDFPERGAAIDEIISMLEEPEGDVQILNPGDSLNSSTAEYLPIPEPSGDRLYFTANNRAGRNSGEDIWVSVKADGGQANDGRRWRTSALDDLNTPDNEGPDAIAPDGSALFVFGNFRGSKGNGDIFRTVSTPSGWSRLQPLPAPINTPYFESDAFLTSDGRALIFSSDRPGSPYGVVPKNRFYGADWWGNTDLYISFVQEDGGFSRPVNLGAFVNTPGSERAPFLHSDGRTLYFSSNGYDAGFGDMDIYKTVRLDDSWQRWSPPRNVGKVVNGAGTDWGFRLTAAADHGWFSGKHDDNLGGDDIYRVVPLPKRAQPESSVTAVRGKVVDAQSGEPLAANIEWRDRESGELLGRLSSRWDTGEFFIALPRGRSYVYYATKDGYLSNSRSLTAGNDGAYSEESVTIPLTSIEEARRSGAEIIINNINFRTGSAELTADSAAELNQFAELLKKTPGLRIEIQGHTDSTGNRARNIKLSEDRASSVRDYLVQRGVKAGRLKVRGFGPDKPVATNDTAEGRRQNRRVSFTILAE